LRIRIIRSRLAIGVGMVVAWALVDRLSDFVLAPALRSLPPGALLIFTKWQSRISMPKGPVPVTCVTYSPDLAQWKCGVVRGRTTTVPGEYACNFAASNSSPSTGRSFDGSPTSTASRAEGGNPQMPANRHSQVESA
jgi:hypothetical protein